MNIELSELDLRYERLRVDRRARHARLVASLSQHGQHDPVLVVTSEEGGYVLIDGYARVRALRELGKDVVSAQVLQLEDGPALVLAWRLEARGRRSALEDGWLVAELIERHGWNQRTIADRLQRSKSWVSRRLALVRELPDAVDAAVRTGRIPAHAAMKYLAPLARANRAHCNQLVVALGDEPMSDRQVHRLYVGYKRADEIGRKRIVEQPRLFLQADAAARDERKLDDGDPAKPLVNDLDAMTGLAHRARRRLQEGVLEELDESRRALVSHAGQQARLAFDRVFRGLREGRCSISTPEPPS